MNRLAFVALAVVLSIALLPQSASAQKTSFSIRIGGHGHGHGHHHHWHPPCDWYHGCYAPWYPSVQYVYPRPAVTYVVPEPAPTVVIPRVSAAAPAREPLAMKPNDLSGGREVRVVNPANSRATVYFVADQSTEAELAPGETRVYTAQPAVVIEFDRGGDFGTARYRLTDGEHEFVATDRGWDLVRRSSASPANRTAVRKNSLPGASLR